MSTTEWRIDPAMVQAPTAYSDMFQDCMHAPGSSEFGLGGSGGLEMSHHPLASPMNLPPIGGNNLVQAEDCDQVGLHHHPSRQQVSHVHIDSRCTS